MRDKLKTSVLIVEEEQVIVRQLLRVVKSLEYEVVGVENNGEKAIEVFEEKSPDILLTDVHLRGVMSGVELVSSIKEHYDIPVVFISASTKDEQVSGIYDVYPSGYLQKPFNDVQLATTLKISLKRFLKQTEAFEKIIKDNKNKEISIKELSETNDHLITATWRERDLKNELQTTKEIIEIQNKKILDSINYAKRIQKCTAPTESDLNDCLKNYFLFYKPKDVVSGDFPWMYEHEDYIYYAAVDCTGHGVPGAMMSMIGHLLLNDVVDNDLKVKTPAEMLAELHRAVVKTLRQDAPENKAADGMDIGLCRLKKDRSELIFSGAHLPLYLLRGKELTEYKGSRCPVGGVQYRNRNKYSDHVVDTQPGDKVFVFSDGMIDQLGGPENRKLMSVGLKEFLIEHADIPIEEMGIKAEEKFHDWMGENKQIDDVILFGVEI